MKANLIKLLVFCGTVLLMSVSLSAQEKQREKASGDSLEKQRLEAEQMFAMVKDTAVVADDRLLSVSMPVKGMVKRFSFDYAVDGKSFFMTDEKGVRLQVFLGADGKISSVVMPDGKRGTFRWKQTPNKLNVMSGIALDSTEASLLEEVEIITDAPVSTTCRDAAVAAVVAIGVCAATGGTSVACWSATAGAAYLAYKCYEETH